MTMQNVVIAIDSFKGSLASLAAGEVAAAAVKSVLPEVKAQVFPLADGGEGTVDALIEGLGGESVAVTVTGPLDTPIASRYGWVAERRLAIIEMADAAGLPLVPVEQRNPLNTTTYGLGELILAAAEAGAREFIIGIGGSATNDCGLGMLTALGVRFLDSEGRALTADDNSVAGAPAGIYGRDVARVAAVDVSGLAPVVRECHFHIACDVNNPLTGERGCSYIYGPQKGATPEIVRSMDESIAQFATVVARDLAPSASGAASGDKAASGTDGSAVDASGAGAAPAATDYATMPGAGAAGGLGFAFRSFLPAMLEPGIEIVLGTLGIERALQSADLVITGEGRMDAQTAMGKAPVGVASLAKRLNPNVKTVAVCGCAERDARRVNECGIDAYFPILHAPMTVAEAMEEQTARTNLAQTVEQIVRLIAR